MIVNQGNTVTQILVRQTDFPPADIPKEVPRAVLKTGRSLAGLSIAPSGITATLTVDQAAPGGQPAALIDVTSAASGYFDLFFGSTDIAKFGGHVGWRLRLQDWAKVNEVRLYNANADYSKYSEMREYIATSGDLRLSGEVVLWVGPSRQSSNTGFVYGTDTLQSTKLRIFVNGATKIWLHSVEVAGFAPPAVAFVFDDSMPSHISDVLPALAKDKLKATFALDTASIAANSPTSLRRADIPTILAAGHQITAHNVQNSRYASPGTGAGQTLAQYVADYRTSRSYLLSQGVPAHHFMYHSYVQGSFDADLITALRGEGVRLARKAYQGHTTFVQGGLGDEAMALRVVELGSFTTLDAAKAAVDRVLQYGGLLCFMGHQIVAGAPAIQTQWSKADLVALLAYVVAKQVQTLTMLEVEDYLKSFANK